MKWLKPGQTVGISEQLVCQGETDARGRFATVGASNCGTCGSIDNFRAKWLVPTSPHSACIERVWNMFLGAFEDAY